MRVVPIRHSSADEVLVESADSLIKSFPGLTGGAQGPVPMSTILSSYEGLVSGRLDLWQPNRQCLASINNNQTLVDHSINTPIGNYIGIEFIVDGGYEQWYGKQCLHNTHTAKIILSSGSSRKKVLLAGGQVKAVALWLPRNLLAEQYGLQADQLPSNILSILSLQKTTAIAFPMSSTIKRIVYDILNHTFTGRMAGMYLTAKFTELLCHTVLSLYDFERSYLHDNNLIKHKSAALAKVVDHLSTHYRDPLPVDKLAEEVGMCKSSLSDMFKRSYGSSISEYLLMKRMEKAQDLILEGKFSMIEVAALVGYEAHSSFARAYRKYHKHSPRDDRPKR